MPHIHELYDFTTSAIIVFEGKTLLFNHPRYDMWLPVGGHIELDETPDECLIREVKEECGLEVEILSDPGFKLGDTQIMTKPEHVTVHDANPPHKHISFVYYLKAKSDQHVQSDEHIDSKWFGLKELEDPEYAIADDIKFYSKEAIKAAG